MGGGGGEGGGGGGGMENKADFVKMYRIFLSFKIPHFFPDLERPFVQTKSLFCHTQNLNTLHCQIMITRPVKCFKLN